MNQKLKKLRGLCHSCNKSNLEIEIDKKNGEPICNECAVKKFLEIPVYFG